MIHALMLQNFVVNICALFLQDWKAGFENFFLSGRLPVSVNICVFMSESTANSFSPIHCWQNQDIRSYHMIDWKHQYIYIYLQYIAKASWEGGVLSPLILLGSWPGSGLDLLGKQKSKQQLSQIENSWLVLHSRTQHTQSYTYIVVKKHEKIDSAVLSQHTIYTKTVQINSFLCVYLWCIPPNTVIQMKIDNQHTIPPLPHTVIQIICKDKAKNRLSTQFIQRQICKLYRKKSCLCVQNYMCTTRSMNIVNEGNTGSWAGPHPQFWILNRNLFDPNKVGQVQNQNGHWEICRRKAQKQC